MREPYYYFVILDFDGTAGDTFKPNKNVIGVDKAYEMACNKIFGNPTGSILYEKVGGLKNRAPVEFMSAVLEVGDKDKLIARAREYLRDHRVGLGDYAPPGKGVDLVWDEGRPLSILTELLVRVKLRLLMAQIGTPCEDGSLWPNPCRGFVDLWRGMLAFNEASSEVKLVPGIVSSGHDIFIQECFEMWKLPKPALMVTDDTMRSLACAHLSVTEKVKPQLGPVRILCEEWLKKQGKVGYDDPLSCIQGRGFCGGDGLQVDGSLAKNLGLCFLWFNPEGKDQENLDGQVVNVIDWREVLRFLTNEKTVEMMKAGQPFADIVRALAPWSP